jgi:hypothetical protein
MASATPGRLSKRTASTGPVLPVMPMAVRDAPGRGCALSPNSSTVRTTSSTCAAVASAFITMSMVNL